MSQPEGKIFVKPAKEKVLVRNPERSRHLKVEGEWVVKNVYWFRRIKDGDVVELKGADLKNKMKEISDTKAKAKKEAVAKAKESANKTTNSVKNQE